MRQHYIIIVAAGSGSRFGSDVPKQFLPLAGKPVVAHAITAFRRALPCGKVLLVLSPEGREYWASLCIEYGIESPQIVTGGSTRTESVGNALAAVKACGCRPEDVVMIHDGARPLISGELIRRVAQAVTSGSCQAAVPGYAPSDSLVHIENTVEPVLRDDYRLVQTPQAFEAEYLFKAYDSLGDRAFTDDLSAVIAAAQATVRIVDGERTNIKITHPGDLDVAQLYLK